jgi:inositol oxygenase
MAKKWHKFGHAKLTIREAFKLLEGYVDSSDPDTELPNMEHMMQTAEGMRA